MIFNKQSTGLHSLFFGVEEPIMQLRGRITLHLEHNFFSFADMDKNKNHLIINVCEILGKLIELNPNLYYVSKLYSPHTFLYTLDVHHVARKPHCSETADALYSRRVS